MEIRQHWLYPARHRPSPNCNPRPQGNAIDLLVIHAISLPPGQFGGPFIADFFTNCLDTGCHSYFDTIKDLEVSSHLLIDREGVITQFVPFDQRAWHAGVSCFTGRDNCNDFSIGIELEGCDELPFEQVQYQRLAEVTRVLMKHYPGITSERIVGHSDIAPGRKTDPGPCFDWQVYFQSVECPLQEPVDE